MRNPRKYAGPWPRFFVFSRLLLQPDGSFIARPAGMFAAETLDQALASATIQARTAGPLLFRLDKVLTPEPSPT